MPLFHALGALALVAFAAGVYSRARFWLEGSVPGAEGRGPMAKARELARRGPGILLRRTSLAALFWDGLVLRQVWRESRLRWLVHVSISYAFVGLFAIGSLGNMAADLGAPLRKDDAWFAALNDSLGLALLAGLALAAGRRYLFPRRHTRTVFEDTAVLAVLGLLAASGLLVEAARYLKEGTPASAGAFAFVGYPLAQAFEPLAWDWSLTYDVLWWAHGLAALGLVAYLPYSKLFHMFTSPLTIALDARAAPPADPEARGMPGEVRPWPA